MNTLDKTTINNDTPSHYIESFSKFHRIKRRLTYNFAFRLLDKFLKPNTCLNLVDIGVGSGYFLSFAKKHYPDAQLFGVEFDDRLIEIAKIQEPSVKFSQSSAENFEFPGLKFDLVTAFQVIEHLYDPSEMLTRIAIQLRPGGIFLLTTPNLEGIGARLMGSKWHGYRDDHVSLKSKSEWDKLVISHGFKLLYSGSTFFSGIPMFNKFPFGILNWALLLFFGSARWSHGESYVGIFTLIDLEDKIEI